MFRNIIKILFMNKLKCAVIGVGYLGRFHAHKYQKLSQDQFHHVELIAVCDTDKNTCDRVAQELNVVAYYDYRDLCNYVDVVSIVTTTKHHYSIAQYCLKHGIHVLLEKPMTETVAQADELIWLAEQYQIKLQIGHLERFNAARIALIPYLNNPLFIESKRLAPFNVRGTDVNVIFDLMIHDIDIIQTIVNAPIVNIDAHGTKVLTSSFDVAIVHLTFANNTVANISASRVSHKVERVTYIYQQDSYIAVDYFQKKLSVFQKINSDIYPGIANIQPEEHVFIDCDAILEEIKAFILCIINDTQPLVTAIDGRNALATAMNITAQINQNFPAIS